MDKIPRILLHNDNTHNLAARLLASFPKADCRECNSYDALPGMIADYRPDVVYSVRFAGTAGYPREALFADGGPRWIANGGWVRITSASGTLNGPQLRTLQVSPPI